MRRRKGKDEEELDIGDIDSYLEKLYDTDLSQRVEGSILIRRLVEVPENWSILVNNLSLMNCLSRTLRNDGKRNLTLNINILYVFYNLTRVEDYQGIILSYGIDEIILERIKYENGRYFIILGRKDLEPKKKNNFFKKQTQLLTVCLYLLLNLFGKVELDHEELVGTLIGMLKRHAGKNNITKMIGTKDTEDLLVIVIQLLLSVCQKDRNLLVNNIEILKTLISLLGYEKQEIVYFVLKLICLFAMDSKPKNMEVLIETIPAFLILVTKEKLHFESLRILYELSKDITSLEYFKIPINELQKKTGMKFIFDVIRRSPKDNFLTNELAALGINLAYDLGMNMKEKDLKGLLERLNKTHDPLLCKLLNNICFHENMRIHFKSSMCRLVKMLSEKKRNPALSVEALSIIGKLSTEDISFKSLFTSEHRFDRVLNRFLTMEKNEDDVILEAVIATGTVLDKKDSYPIAKIVGRTKIICKICRVFVSRQNDQEFILQCLYTFYSAIKYKETRIMLFEEEEAIDCIINLYDHQNGLIKKMVDLMLDSLSSTSEEIKKKIIRKKFQMHNAEWCAVISQNSDGPISIGDSLKESNELNSSSELYESYESENSDDDDDDDDDDSENEKI